MRILSLCLLAAPLTAAAAGPVDLDNDGYDDLLAGLPYEDIGDITDGGTVVWVWGSSAGLIDQTGTYKNQGQLGDIDSVGDNMGRALAAGDLNADGYTDIVAAAPLEDDVAVDEGMVHVIFGSASGPATVGALTVTQDDLSLETSEEDDRFGHALAVGDFDCNGYDDVAIAILREESDVATDGAVYLGYFDADGVMIGQDQVLYGDTVGTPTALLAADFDDDGCMELVVGAGKDDRNKGKLTVLPGTSAGLDSSLAQTWEQSDLGETRERGDRFAWKGLAAGDFDGDGYMDLAVGAHGEELSGLADVGMVHVLYGGASGLTAAGAQEILQGSTYGGAAGDDDVFGKQLVAADFDGDGHDDLVIGVPGENGKAGAVTVLYGSGGGLVPGDWIDQDDLSEDSSEAGDRFGKALAAGDYNGDGYADLVVGIPNEEVSGLSDAGAVVVIYGDYKGLNPNDDERFTQEDDIPTPLEEGDRFGVVLR